MTERTARTGMLFYFPLGDARRTLDAFVALLQGFDVQEAVDGVEVIG